MAADKKKMDSETKVKRGATRTLVNTILLLIALAVLAGWAKGAFYRLELGESAVILRLGALNRIDSIEGLRLHWPPPLETHEIVNTSGLRTESFGTQASRSTPGQPTDQEEKEIARQIRRDAIQTADSNIVNVAYELQYKVEDAYAFAFGMADVGSILHDATEASVRDEIGKRSIDAVLSRDRSEIEVESQKLLQAMLDSYFESVGLVSAFKVDKINLQKPQAPEAVREAFADVVSAGQDEKRALSSAEGDIREILERARAEAAELREQAEAYKRAKIIEAQGEATRFNALLTEYQAAPEVTRRRLYIETMEEILPTMDKMVVEAETLNMLPMLPLGNAPTRAAGGANP